MTIARITTWADGQILTAAALNAEFDNLVTPINAQGLPTAPGASRVSGLVGSMASNIGSFAALGYTFQSTALQYSLTATSSYSINTQTAGPIINGRDQAAVFASTDVHFYALTTGAGSTAAAGIASTRPPPLGPTMPTSYVGWAYLASAKYSTGSSAVFVPAGVGLYVNGARMSYSNPSTNAVSGTAGFGAVETLISLSSLVPALSPECLIHIKQYRSQTAAAGTAVASEMVLRSESGVDLITLYTGQSNTSALGFSPKVSAMIPWALQSTQTHRIYYEHNIVSGTSVGFTASLVSYRVPNGDV